MQLRMSSQKFSLEDREVFDNAYGQLSRPLAELSFSWLQLWDCYRDVEWKTINGNLCLFLTFEGRRCVWGPVLPGKKLKDTVEKCFRLCRNYSLRHNVTGKPAMAYIPEELKRQYAELEGFQLLERSRDFVYRTEDVIGLRGEKYRDKRNKRNFFVKNYRSLIEEYSSRKHKKGCTELLERWMKQKAGSLSEDDREKLKWDTEACRKTFELAETLGIKGMVALVEGVVEGFIFGKKTNENTCTMFFGKTNLEIKGLSQFIYGELLRIAFSGCEFVNDGEDWGVGYLRNSKMSYNPDYVNRGYTLVVK